MPPWRLQDDDDPLVAATDLDSHLRGSPPI
jgi:hypothetical protein